MKRGKKTYSVSRQFEAIYILSRSACVLGATKGCSLPQAPPFFRLSVVSRLGFQSPDPHLHHRRAWSCGLASVKPRSRSGFPVLASLNSVQRCRRLRHIGLGLVSSSDHRNLRDHARPPCRRRRPRKTSSTRPSRVPAPCDPSSPVQQPAPWKSVSAESQGKEKKRKIKQGGNKKRSRMQSLTPLSRSHHIPRRMYVADPLNSQFQALLTTRSDTRDSRQDTDTAQPQVGRRAEAAVAAIRQAVVCRVHDADHWQLGQGGDSYVARMQWDAREMSSQN